MKLKVVDKLYSEKTRILMFLVVFIINTLSSFIFPNLISSALSTILYITLLVFILRVSPIALLIFSPIIFLHLSVLISLNSIESGAYMKEVGRFGHASTASSTYFLVVSLFLIAALAIFHFTEKKRVYNSKQFIINQYPFLFKRIAIVIICFIIFYLFVKGLVSGFPLLDKTDRYAYRQESADKLTIYFLNLKLVLAAFLSLSKTNCVSRNYKLQYDVVFTLYIIVSFLFGDKFFSIITGVLFYIGVQLSRDHDERKKNMNKFFLYGVIALLFAFLVTFFVYSNHGEIGFLDTLELFGERFSEQGQLWFVTYNDNSKWIDFDSDAVEKNINSLFYIPAIDYVFDNHLGPFHFVYRYSPSEIVTAFEANNGYVGPVMGFEAYGLELFGFIGLFFVAISAGGLMGLIGHFIMNAISSSNPVNIILPVYFFTQFYYLIVSENISLILGLGPLKAYLAMYILKLLVSSWIYRKDRVILTKFN